MPDTVHSWTDGIFLKVINILVYVFLLGSNIYSVAVPGDIYTNSKQTCKHSNALHFTYMHQTPSQTLPLHLGRSLSGLCFLDVVSHRT